MSAMPRLLMIDDDEDEYLLAAEALRSVDSEYRLKWAGSFDEGRTAIERGEYDLYLIDYSLVEHTGVELLHYARSIGSTAALIMLTGHTEAYIDRESMMAGADDYLIKRGLSGTLFDRAIRYGLERTRSRGRLREANELLEKRVEERTNELQATLQQLHIAYDAQRRFVADASHDLRTPLTVIATEISLIRQSADIPPTVLEPLVRLSHASGRLQAMVANLLLLATIDSGTIQQNRVELALDQLLFECIAEFESLTIAKALRVDIDVRDGVNIWGNETALASAFANVLSNAVNYSRSGGCIAIRMRPQGDEVTVEFEDDGVGIDSADLPFVCDRSFRGDRTRSTSGTGLGLSIVRGVIAQHNGQVHIRSQLGIGTVVALTLPIGSGY